MNPLTIPASLIRPWYLSRKALICHFVIICTDRLSWGLGSNPHQLACTIWTDWSPDKPSVTTVVTIKSFWESSNRHASSIKTEILIYSWSFDYSIGFPFGGSYYLWIECQSVLNWSCTVVDLRFLFEVSIAWYFDMKNATKSCSRPLPLAKLQQGGHKFI